MGLSVGGLICRGSLYVSQKVSERTEVRWNENIYSKNVKEMYHIIIYLLNKEYLYLKFYFSGSKFGINGYTPDGLCARGLI